MRNFTLWDDQDINHKVLVGEYGVARDNGNEELWSNHRPRPWWIASVAEAVFWLGTERNPDKVYGSAFAPLLQHIDHYQWNVSSKLPLLPAQHILMPTAQPDYL